MSFAPKNNPLDCFYPRVRAGRREGAVAQLGERLLCKQEVIGSIPFSSTRARMSRARCQRSDVSCQWFFVGLF